MPAKPRGHSGRTPRPRPVQRSKPRRPKTSRRTRWNGDALSLLLFEWLGLGVLIVLGIMWALGWLAQNLSGTNLYANLLPFAGVVAGLVVVAAFGLRAWGKLRIQLARFWSLLPSLLTTALCGWMVWFVFNEGQADTFSHFRALVGGKQQAERGTIAHQVFAAYRRHERTALEQLYQRAQMYQTPIQQAAQAFAVDEQVLYGLAATESSFLPRDSQDGGHGLFQITAVPNEILQLVRQRLKLSKLDLNNPQHNAYIAAATLQHYLAQMHDDLFMGLLAYNIGPRNGGLRFIMQQYGATDFVTLQPYLQQLPRDYPIRVLAFALAFKIHQQFGSFLAYEEANNAQRIQKLGIPGWPSDL